MQTMLFRSSSLGLSKPFADHRAAPLTLVGLVAGLIVAGTPGHADASDRRTTATAYSVSVREGEDQEQDMDVAGTSLILSVAGSASGPTNGAAVAFAGFKKVSAQAKAITTGAAASLSHGQGKSTDKLTLDVRGVPAGEPLNLLLELSIDGELTGGATCPIGDAYFSSLGGFSLRYGPPNQYPEVSVAFGMIDNDPDSPDFNFKPGTVSLSLDWVNGAEYSMLMNAYASVDAAANSGDCSAHADAELSHTFKWMGVTGVTDDLGNIYTDFTLTDEYGNNWRTPANDADVTSDGAVNIDDLVAVITSWGPCGQICVADVNEDDVVNIDDLVLVITGWDS